MLDYKSLKGDPTDNIPGIPGVGEKTASKLVATWGTLDELYAHLDEVTPEKLRAPLEEHRDSRAREPRADAARARRRRRRSTRAAGGWGSTTARTVVRLFREYEFRTLIDRLPPLVGERPEDAVAAMRELREAGFPAAQGVGRAAGTGAGAPVDRRRRSSCRWTSTWSRRRAAGGEPAADRRDVARGRGARGGDRRGVRRPPGRARGRDRGPGPDRGRRGGRGRGPRDVAPGPAGGRDRARGRRSAAARRRRRCRSPSRAPDGRVVAADGVDASIALRHLLEAIDARLVGPRRQAAADGPVRRGPGRATPLAVDVRHPDRRLPRQRRAAGPEDRRRRRRSGWTSCCPPAAAGPAAGRDGRARGAVVARRPAVARAGAARRLGRPAVRRGRAAADPDPRPHGGRRHRARPRGAGRARARVRRRDRAASRPRSTPPSATSSRSARPKQLGDILFVELGLPKGRRTKTGYSTDASVLEELRGVHPVDRADPRVADLHQAPVDLRRGAADADRPRRAPPHAVPPGRRGDRAAVVVGPQPPEHPDPHAARPADPARVRRRLARHDAGRRRLQPDRAADPRPRLGRRAPCATRSRARPTSIARPRPACSARTPRTSRPTSGRWPRWSTSGWRTG